MDRIAKWKSCYDKKRGVCVGVNIYKYNRNSNVNMRLKAEENELSVYNKQRYHLVLHVGASNSLCIYLQEAHLSVSETLQGH